MKKVLVILLLVASLSFGQNPCNDLKYRELLKKDVKEMSVHEYQYFTQKRAECHERMNDARPKRYDNIGKYALVVGIITTIVGVAAFGVIGYAESN